MAVLSFPDIRLAVPLTEVHSLVSVLDLDESGAVEVNGRVLPTYGFDSELRTLSTMPEDYRICANLGTGNPELGIICQSIETLEQVVIEEALPACMATNSSIVKGLALHDGEVLLCTNLATLIASIALDDQSGGGLL